MWRDNDQSGNGGNGFLSRFVNSASKGFKPDLPDLIGSAGCYISQHGGRYCDPRCNLYTKCSRGFYS